MVRDPNRLALAVRGLARMLLWRGGHRGEVSDHFDGRRFHNVDGPQARGYGGVWRWRLERMRGGLERWPTWTEAQPGAAPPRRVEGTGLRLTFVNHATVLLQTGGMNVLTDPIWSWRASPVPWAGPKRRRPPGILMEDLPPIDVVLVSHNHYDHMDLPTLRTLKSVHAPRFFTPWGNGELLQREGIGPVTEMDWWQTATLAEPMQLTCVPARHFSSRGFLDHDRTLWCGFVIHGESGPIYFAADTGFGSHFEQIAKRFGPPRLALLPIGAYLPRWFMGPVHMSPTQAVQAHQILRARMSIGIHFGTFANADDSPRQALEELHNAWQQRAQQTGEFRVLEPGEALEAPE